MWSISSHVKNTQQTNRCNPVSVNDFSYYLLPSMAEHGGWGASVGTELQKSFI